jgi:hypothetical protein
VRQITEREELAQNLSARYTGSRSRRGAHEPLAGVARKAARLQDAYSGNKDISEKSKSWTVAPDCMQAPNRLRRGARAGPEQG